MSEKYSYKIAWNIPMNCTSDSAGAPSARHRCKADSFFWKVAKKTKSHREWEWEGSLAYVRIGLHQSWVPLTVPESSLWTVIE